jgi:hypothetical protein
MISEIAWEKPEVKDLGKAEDIIKDVSSIGSRDSQFSVLDPS